MAVAAVSSSVVAGALRGWPAQGALVAPAVELSLAFLDEHHDRSRELTGLVIEAIRRFGVAAHVGTFERHSAETNVSKLGDEANHARRKARFNVAFQSSAKSVAGGESENSFLAQP